MGGGGGRFGRDGGSGGRAVRRSGGQAVRRSGGQAVRRSGGQAVRRSGGQAVRRSGGQAVRRSGGRAGRYAFIATDSSSRGGAGGPQGASVRVQFPARSQRSKRTAATEGPAVPTTAATACPHANMPAQAYIRKR